MCACALNVIMTVLSMQSETQIKDVERNVKQLKVLTEQNQNTLAQHKMELEKSLQSLGEVVETITESVIVELKRSQKTLYGRIRNEMAEIEESVKVELKKSRESLDGVKEEVRKEMGEIKESMAALKAPMTKHFEI